MELLVGGRVAERKTGLVFMQAQVFIQNGYLKMGVEIMIQVRAKEKETQRFWHRHHRQGTRKHRSARRRQRQRSDTRKLWRRRHRQSTGPICCSPIL